MAPSVKLILPGSDLSHNELIKLSPGYRISTDRVLSADLLLNGTQVKIDTNTQGQHRLYPLGEDGTEICSLYGRKPGDPLLRITVDDPDGIASLGACVQLILSCKSGDPAGCRILTSKIEHLPNRTVYRWEFDFSLHDQERFPIGIWGTFTCQIISLGTKHEKQDVSSSTPIKLEFYSVAEERLLNGARHPIFREGLPLELLRMFWSSGAHHDIKNAHDWERNAVEICFGSRAPRTGQKQNTAQHWLKFDSFGGAPSFAYPDGTLMSPNTLDRWLDHYRLWRQEKKTVNVNCYDQAFIAEVALSQFVDHRRIIWEYHQPFGFIDSDLVGWGMCNNPFFQGDPDQKVVLDRQDRLPFANHAHLSYSRSGQILTDAHRQAIRTIAIMAGDYIHFVSMMREFEEKEKIELGIVDACTGPSDGRTSRESYTRLHDHICDPKHSWSNFVRKAYASYPEGWRFKASLGTGVAGYLEGKKDTRKHRSVGPLAESIEVEQRRIRKLLNTDHEAPLSANAIPDIPVTELGRMFTETVRASRSDWSEVDLMQMRPYTRDDGAGVNEFRLDYRKEGIQGASCYCTFTVTAWSTATDVVEQLSYDLALTTLGSSHPYKDSAFHRCPFPGVNICYLANNDTRVLVLANTAITIKGHDLGKLGGENDLGFVFAEVLEKRGQGKP